MAAKILRNADGTIRGWSNSGTLITGGGVRGNNSKGVKLQASLAQEDSLTTQFNVTGLQVGNTRAEIVSSVQGNSVRRVLTVVDGASITTRGKNIAVTVRDYSSTVISGSVPYKVAILSTLGVRASINQPPILEPLEYAVNFAAIQDKDYLEYLGLLDVPAGTQLFVPVPEDSGVNSVFVTVTNDDGLAFLQNQVRVEQLTQLGGSMKSYDPLIYTGFVPLAPNVNSLALVNAAASVGNALFAITFGVDG